ncbi:DUF4345 family protein [Dinoroseobacter sp. PD6]|uniref:DUF4345 family protein n=1 Tax=Dinoroseobacter sp. PD6 TaxID=3028384 RepID=UPI00237BEA57|nr:DUF4345 family protein [Dinoroseobacter sp. PD6]MDD9716428.1 DUF4345 family protein [Dinoroseobacter sp. PD6]
MIDILNIFIALISIGLGLFGWLAPKYTMEALDLKRGETTMGVSEIRASAGALFVGLGIGAILLGTPTAYAMIGFAWGGAAVGRMTSILRDEAPTRRTWGFFATEALVAATALAINL